ncbi:SDR family oxidoreductase [uncultured Sphingomonas sp.]|uniref:SDR family oxidoreductase n=1 Tax=uncultured Sphingomonas sp. TaxID=158754 RepID=UPI0026385765|nr:SDR family oxidoreductase [uncultured Sphingomonas sp.]
MAGKTIVITGANGGLGRALAQRFANDGDTVMMLGRSLAKVTEVADAIGGNALPIECDVTSPDSVRTAFVAIAEAHGKIDALINNAAVFYPVQIEEASDDDIMGHVLTNLAGPILCARSAIPLINRGGHIINLSSESVENTTFPHLTLYQSTKGGLERFSQHLHREVEGRGIRVTTVRAGQMIGPGSSAVVDPERFGRFFAEATNRGLKIMERGMSRYDSATQVFRSLVDLPVDVHVGTVVFEGRLPDPAPDAINV